MNDYGERQHDNTRVKWVLHAAHAVERTMHLVAPCDAEEFATRHVLGASAAFLSTHAEVNVAQGRIAYLVLSLDLVVCD